MAIASFYLIKDYYFTKNLYVLRRKVSILLKLSKFAREAGKKKMPTPKTENIVMSLNKAKGKPQLYFVCGITLYSPLAKNLSEHFSCNGIYVPQEDIFLKNEGGNTSLTIPYLASLYVEAILKHASENTENKNALPSIAVGGVSFGGVLAFEIARQLEQKKCNISGLIILDTILPGALSRPWTLTVKLAMKKIKTIITSMINTPSSQTKSKTSAREKRKSDLWKLIKSKSTQAYFKTLPTFSGLTLIIRAADQYGHTAEPSLCWAPKLKGPLILGESPGTHLETIKSKETAILISDHIIPSDSDLKQ